MAQPCEQPGKATDDGVASLAVAPVLKGTQIKIEAWSSVAGLKCLHRAAQEKLLGKVPPHCTRHPNILEMPVPWNEMSTNDGAGCGVDQAYTYEINYASNGKAREQHWPQPFGAQRMLSSRGQALNSLHCRIWGLLWTDCDYALFTPSWSKNVFDLCFCFTRSHS